MRRTDKTINIKIELITITLDEPSEIKRWNQEKHDLDSAMGYIEELCEIDYSTNHNTVFQLEENLYQLIADYNGKIYQIKVITKLC